MTNIKQLIEQESNIHKYETDYIASQEYICGCSNENDKLFCWEASTACSIQARESFQAGASFILSKWQEATRWRKVEEQLPELGIYVLTKRKRRYDNKEYHAINMMYFEEKAGKAIWEVQIPDTSVTIEWRPIESGRE